MDRRDFLKTVGLGVASGVLTSPLGAMAGPFTRPADGVEHFVPVDKKLSREWVRSLMERGGPEVWSGKALDTIGMPIGGIGAGQLYLRGDGTLGCWQIFNHLHFTGYGETNYQYRTPDAPVDQGFAVRVEVDGKTIEKPLDRKGFGRVEFIGEYPIGKVRYADDSVPVKAELEAFSPFIPSNALDSTLPATLLHFTVENTTGQSMKAAVHGHLANPVLFHSFPHLRTAARRSYYRHNNERALGVHTAEALPPHQAPPVRPPVLLADFEGSDYGDWKTEGEAFGAGPAAGSLPNQNKVIDFEGKGLASSYHGGDKAKGTLTSPPFKITRAYINLLVGGGAHKNITCANLLIDGKVVHSAIGEHKDKLFWRTWDVRPYEGEEARIQVVDNHSEGWGHVMVDHVELSDERREAPTGPIEKLYDFGSIVLGCQGEAHGLTDASNGLCTVQAGPVEIAPGAKHTFVFVLAWYFPNLHAAPQIGGNLVGREYANRFTDAAAVADYVLDNHDRLTRETRQWQATYYDSTLPYWLLNRMGSTLSNLATGTTQIWSNGRFWGWEGVGCCEGTCTHVWNYAHALARLFPGLERSIRELQDLKDALHPDGLVGFRGTRNGHYAADGQCGTVLKCWREHLMSADDAFLKRNWPNIRKVLEFSIRHDANADGLIEDSQHNTYDINFQGPNSFVGALYLAALRAGEEMARVVGQKDFADDLRRIAEKGREQTMKRLWNGTYFVQLVDAEKHKYQYADGCLSDQVFGQNWAHQVALGYVYPADKVRQALEAVWRFNWAPDVGPQNAKYKPERWFIAPGEAGLFTCTWPLSKRPSEPVRYRNEIWTGIEYQVAGGMVWEGMLEEALVMVRAIHDRYHPLKHNPYNEIECGDHYARALASWGLFTALAGYEYDGPHGYLAFAPRFRPEDFRTAFTTAEGWGTFAQQREEGKFTARIDLRYGRLTLRTLALQFAPDGPAKALARRNGQELTIRSERKADRLLITFPPDLVLRAGEALEVQAG
jgi:uncharacterized protein (DUF608 family)